MVGGPLRVFRAALVALACTTATAGIALAACTSFSGDSGDVTTPDGSSDGAVPDGNGAAPDGGVGSFPPCGTFSGEPEALAVNEDGPTNVVADAVSVYWARQTGAIRTTSVRTPRQAADFLGDAGSNALVLTSGFVVWRHAVGITARAKQPPASPNVVLYTEGNATAPVTMSADKIAFARSFSILGRIVSVTPTFDDLLKDQASVTTLAYAEGQVSFLGQADGGPPALFTCGAAGADCPRRAALLVSGVDGAVAIVADATYVYWVDDRVGKAFRVKRDVNAKPEAVMSGLTAPFAIAVDEAHVYVAMRKGGVARAPKDGSPCAVTPNNVTVTSFALFDHFVYFTDVNSVRRLTK